MLKQKPPLPEKPWKYIAIGTVTCAVVGFLQNQSPPPPPRIVTGMYRGEPISFPISTIRWMKKKNDCLLVCTDKCFLSTEVNDKYKVCDMENPISYKLLTSEVAREK